MCILWGIGTLHHVCSEKLLHMIGTSDVTKLDTHDVVI